MAMNDFVTPGEKVATEEEFAAGNNTYVEEGIIYSSVIGNVEKANGSVEVHPAGREIKIIDRDMLIIGTVTDDVKSVIFVKIDDINVGSKDFLALKDGKIIVDRPRPPRFGGGGGGRDNRFSHEKPMKSCGVGDTIIARVQYNDKDAYTLSLNGRETGVIYARCELCGTEGMKMEGSNLLVCADCGHKETRKISELYNRAEEIQKLFA
jgi:exosome complex RNA-binding protein Csl4